jgi:hypothetical protein
MSLLSSLHSAKSSGLFPQDSLKLYCLLPSFFFSCGRSFVSAIGTAYLYLRYLRSIHFHYQLTFTSNCSVATKSGITPKAVAFYSLPAVS